MSIAREKFTDQLAKASLPPSSRGDWTWELVTMFPQQGEWTEEEDLLLDTNRLVEFSDSVLEFLPKPKPSRSSAGRAAPFKLEIRLWG